MGEEERYNLRDAECCNNCNHGLTDEGIHGYWCEATSLSFDEENQVCDYFLKKAYVGLINDKGQEVSGEGYSRAEIKDSSVTFPEAKGEWGTVTHTAYFLRRFGGKPFEECYGFMNRAVLIRKGDALTVPIL